MPSKKPNKIPNRFSKSWPGAWQKPRPAILKTPLQYKIDFSPEDSAGQAAEDARIADEVIKRLRAVAEYYGVSWEPQRARDPQSFDLIFLMARDLFYSALKIVPEGTEVSKKITWTAARKIELLTMMRTCINEGLTQHQAAEVYRQCYPHLGSASTVVTRFHEAKRWEKSGEPMTTKDMMDLRRYVRELPPR